jgi:alpha-L-rhamnosidase
MKFDKAKPVWLKGKTLEMNIMAGFKCNFESDKTKKTKIKIAGSTVFKIFVNGTFIHFGPDRTAHGFARVKILNISDYLIVGVNTVCIEACGYNANGYGQINEPSFLQAELLEDNKVVKFTDTFNKNFFAYHLTQKIQNIQRYSYQRAFAEAYRLSVTTNDWQKADTSITKFQLEDAPSRKLLDCTAPTADFTFEENTSLVETGKLETFENAAPLFRDRAITKISPEFLGFPIEKIDLLLTDILHHLKAVSPKKDTANSKSVTIQTKEYALWKMKKNYSGFISFAISSKKKTTLAITFDEILTEDKLKYTRLGSCNIAYYELEPGDYKIESFEPYTFQYLQFNLLEGDAIISNVGIRHVRCKETNRISFQSNDKEMELLFETGIETFRQNAVDIFMDCPSRERAGWLCDSYYTGRAEKDITGKNLIEKAFLENYAVAEKFKHLPEGMVAMCFPADNYNGNFIPNWSLWFILEIEEYLNRTGDIALAFQLQKKVEGLMQYFETLTNDIGLLENLKGWIFVEWSMANKFVDGINYPSNMLYAAALECADRLYKKPQYAEKAKNIRKQILTNSFNGKFFRDQSLRAEGKIKHTENYSETCQYFAFYFGIATPETQPELWEALTNSFGPDRVKNKLFPEIHPSNAFIGNLMRMDILGKHGLIEKQLEEVKKYYLFMAKETGTFWENDNRGASLNHGFASCICHFFIRDVIGIKVNEQIKLITWNLRALPDKSFQLTLPLGDSTANFSTEFKNKKISYSHAIPNNYRIEIIEHPNFNAQLIL